MAGTVWAFLRFKARAEKQVRRFRRELAEVQHLGRLGSWEWDIARNRVVWSEELYRIYGLDPETFQATYQGFLERVHEVDRGMIEAAVMRAMEDGQPFEFQHRIHRPDGEIRVLHGRGMVVRDSSGRPVRMYGTGQDVTEARRAEEALRDSEQRFRSVVENAQDLIFTASTDGSLTSVNASFERVTGWPRKHWLGRPLSSLLHPDDLPFTWVRIKRALQGEVPPMAECRIRNRTGEYRIGEIVITPKIEGEKVVGINGITRDVTERRRVEEALRQSETRYRLVTRATKDAIWDWSLVLQRRDWNEGIQTLLGGSTRAVESDPSWWFGRIHPEDRKRVVSGLWTFIQGGGDIWSNEYRVLRWDGSYALVEDRGCLIQNEDGKPVRMVGAITDITERNKAAEEIRRRNQELTALNLFIGEVSRSLDFSQIVAGMKRVLGEVLAVPGGMIYILDESMDKLHLQDSWGMPQSTTDAVRTLPVQEQAVDSVLKGKTAVHWDDLSQPDFPLARLVHSMGSGWGGGAAVPMWTNGEVHGLLCVFMRAPSVIREDQAAFFTTLGREIGVAIQNARLFEQVRAGRERLKTMSRRLMEVQEEERRRIARELHDEIGQVLTGLKITLEMCLRNSLPPGSSGAVRLGEAQQWLNDLILRVRELSLDLRPAMLDDLGLMPALQWQFERYTAQTGVRVVLEHDGLERRFAPEIETAAFRIAQEALTNVARHARVKVARVVLWLTSEALMLRIEDGGVGFNSSGPAMKTETAGLSGMRERAVLAGGRLTVESGPGKGTRLTAELPLGGPIRKRRKKR